MIAITADTTSNDKTSMSHTERYHARCAAEQAEAEASAEALKAVKAAWAAATLDTPAAREAAEVQMDRAIKALASATLRNEKATRLERLAAADGVYTI